MKRLLAFVVVLVTGQAVDFLNAIVRRFAVPTRPRSISFAPLGCSGRTEAQKEAVRFYKRSAWLRMRAVVLHSQEDALCRDCPPESRQPSTHVHHLKELITHPHLALVRENLIGLCDACHTKRHKGKRYGR